MQYRTRVKDLLRAHRRGDREAIARVAQQLGDRDRLQLADARLVIAREAGFASWPRLERHITRPPPQARRCPRLHAAVHAGDVAAVRAALADATFSPWQTREAIEAAIERDDRAIVHVLLDHGGWVDTAGRGFGRWGGGLHAALLLGRDVAMIEELLAGGASIAARDRDGRTPLAIAVRTHHPSELVLRRAGATDDEVDAVDRMLGACIAGGHPARTTLPLRRSDHQHLAWALRRGHAAALPALLAVGLDPDVPDDDGDTPLHLACTRAAIDALLAAGARPDALDFFGERPDGTSEPVDDRLFEAAVEAIIAGRIDELRALLDRDPRLVTARSRRDHRATLLHYVGANGVEEARQQSPPEGPAIATLLVARGADPDALALTYGGGPAQTTLYLAATSSHPADAGIMVPLIEALVAAGARVEHDDRDAIHTSRRCALPALVAAGAVVDLWMAAALGRTDDVRRLVRADGTLAPGAKVGSEATTPDREIVSRAFRVACDEGHRAIVELLVDADADLASRDVVGMTGLHLAAWNDHLAVAQLLVARGAPLDAKNIYGGTPHAMLRWAIERDRRDRPHAAELLALLVPAT